jgi:hypothetical protein
MTLSPRMTSGCFWNPVDESLELDLAASWHDMITLMRWAISCLGLLTPFFFAFDVIAFHVHPRFALYVLFPMNTGPFHSKDIPRAAVLDLCLVEELRFPAIAPMRSRHPPRA